MSTTTARTMMMLGAALFLGMTVVIAQYTYTSTSSSRPPGGQATATPEELLKGEGTNTLKLSESDDPAILEKQADDTNLDGMGTEADDFEKGIDRSDLPEE
jgi:hypothetical protein